MDKIDGNTLKNWAEWLMNEGSGCCRHFLLTDDNDLDWYILMGWSDGYENDETGEEPWADGTYRINTMIGFQDHSSMMQSDLDVDFSCPYNKDTGDCDDTHVTLTEASPDWNALAEELNKTAERVIKTWAGKINLFEEE